METKNTLGKEITKNFFLNESGYSDLKALWKVKLDNGFEPNADDLAIYAMLRGRDWRKGYTPISNKNKLSSSCGGFPLYNLWQVYWVIRKDTISKEKHGNAWFGHLINWDANFPKFNCTTSIGDYAYELD